MELTSKITQIVGPLLILRGISVFLVPRHFKNMMQKIDQEIESVSFSMIPVFLFSVFLSYSLFFRDTSSVAGILLLIIGIGGVLKCTAIILFPSLISVKVKLLAGTGFVYLVGTVSLLSGLYFSWFGFFN